MNQEEREAMQAALDALLSGNNDCGELSHSRGDYHNRDEPCKPMLRWDAAIAKLREALAQPEQIEPTIARSI